MRFTRKLSFALVLLLLFLLPGGAARANIAYTTAGAEPLSGRVGIVSITGSGSADVSPSVLTGQPSDATVFAFEREEDRYVLVCTGGGTGTRVSAYSLARGWAAPTVSADWPTLRGLRGLDVSDNGRSLFAAGYDSGNIIEIRTETLLPTGTTLVCSVDAGHVARAVQVCVRHQELYGLFSVTGSGGVPAQGRLFRLDGQLKPYSSFDVGLDVADMALYDDKRMIAMSGAGIGGADGGVNVFDPNRDKVSHFISADVYGTVTAVCEDGEDGLYFIGSRGGASQATLYHWKKSGITTVQGIAAGGENCRMVWDGDSRTMALSTGGSILLFKDKQLLRTLSGAELGGTVTSLTAFREAREEDNSSSCSAVGAGLWAMFLPLAFLCRRGTNALRRS